MNLSVSKAEEILGPRGGFAILEVGHVLFLI